MEVKKWALMIGVAVQVVLAMVLLHFVPSAGPVDWGSATTTNCLLAAIALGIWVRGE